MNPGMSCWNPAIWALLGLGGVMLFSKSSKIIGSITMSLFLTNVPAMAVAETGMIQTHSVVNDLTRSEARQNVHDFLSRSEVQEELIARGLTLDEATLRVASLSEQELTQLSGQISQARAGGDVLVTILLVVLIIFLIKRI